MSVCRSVFACVSHRLGRLTPVAYLAMKRGSYSNDNPHGFSNASAMQATRARCRSSCFAASVPAMSSQARQMAFWRSSTRGTDPATISSRMLGIRISRKRNSPPNLLGLRSADNLRRLHRGDAAATSCTSYVSRTLSASPPPRSALSVWPGPMMSQFSTESSGPGLSGSKVATHLVAGVLAASGHRVF